MQDAHAIDMGAPIVRPRNTMYGFNYFDGYEGAYFNPQPEYYQSEAGPVFLEPEHRIVTRSSGVPSYFDFMKNKPFSNMMMSGGTGEQQASEPASKRNPYVDQQQLMHMQFQRLLGMQHQQQMDMQRRQQSYMKNLQQLEHQHSPVHPFSMPPQTRTLYPPQSKSMMSAPQMNPFSQSPFPGAPQQSFMPPNMQGMPGMPADMSNNPFQHPGAVAASVELGSKRFPPLSPELNDFLHTPLKDLLKVEQMAKVNHEAFAPSLLGLFNLINKDKPLTGTGHGVE